MAIQLEVLQGTKMSMIEAALDELPDDINMVYERALQKSPDPSITIRALEWLAYVGGNMKLDTLVSFTSLKPVFHCEALESTVEVKSLYDDDLDIAAPEDILRWLPGLVVVHTDGVGSQSVRLCHFSLLEFLNSPHAKEPWRIEPADARLHIAQSGLAYCLYTIDRASSQKSSPPRTVLSGRDLIHCLEMIAHIAEQSYTETFPLLIRKLFDPSSYYLGHLPDLLGNARGFPVFRTPGVPEMPLQLLYRRGLEPLVPAVIHVVPEAVNMVEAFNFTHTGLSMAAYCLDEEIIAILLGAGAEPFAFRFNSTNALRAGFSGFANWGKVFQKSLVPCFKLLLEASGPDVIKWYDERPCDHFDEGPLDWVLNLPWDPELSPHLADYTIERGADVSRALFSTVDHKLVNQSTSWLIERGAVVTGTAMQAAIDHFLDRLSSAKAYGDETVQAATHREFPPCSFDCLQLLLSSGGVVPPCPEEVFIDTTVYEWFSPEFWEQLEPWDMVKRRAFRIVFEAKSRDGTYVDSPPEASEDFGRWRQVLQWLMTKKASQWPPEVAPPNERDMDFFEEYWKVWYRRSR